MENIRKALINKKNIILVISQRHLILSVFATHTIYNYVLYYVICKPIWLNLRYELQKRPHKFCLIIKNLHGNMTYGERSHSKNTGVCNEYAHAWLAACCSDVHGIDIILTVSCT